MKNKLGLIAGNGRFPFIFAEAAKKKGAELVCIAIKEETSKELENFVDKIYWLSVGELEKLFEILLKESLKSIVMAGQVRHKLIFDKGIKLDTKMSLLLNSVKDKKTDSLIGAVAFQLERLGIEVLDSTTFLQDLLASKGIMTKTELEGKILEDIKFGTAIAKGIASFDIGQTVAVKDKTVLAVESIEGTNEAIKRAYKYGGEDMVVVKVSKPNQDMRFDVPVIGMETIELLKELKAKCLAIEANKTLIIDKGETIKLADDAQIGIVGI